MFRKFSFSFLSSEEVVFVAVGALSVDFFFFSQRDIGFEMAALFLAW